MAEIEAKHIMYKTNGTHWFDVNYNLNLYRGCLHGCIYCDSRSECYGNDDFDHVHWKKDALRLLELDMKRTQKKGVIGMGAMSDPYNPLERTMELTRGALKLIRKYGFGVCLATKSDLVIRDIDLLKEIAKQAPVLIKVTITTLDHDLCSFIEPHVCDSDARFEAIKQLRSHSVPAGILLMPLLPYLNDTWENVGGIIDKAKAVDASFIYPAFGLTMRDRQREYLYQKLAEKDPQLPLKYQRRYGNYYSCGVPNAGILSKQFAMKCREYHIPYQMNRIIRMYREPYEVKQMALF